MLKKIGRAAAVIGVILLYAAAAIGIIYLVKLSGTYLAGGGTMGHIYKGTVLYDNMKHGNYFPLYDEFLYNGVQMMRYQAPLPAYFMAGCQALASGNALNGYLLFVGLIFFLGSLPWLFIGVRKNRFLMGSFWGPLWFFMPNNLYALFVEGNLPLCLFMVFLPLLFYYLYEYMFEKKWAAAGKIVPVFVCLALCHFGYAVITAVSLLIFLLLYRLIYKQKGRCLPIIFSMALPFLIIGIWLYASLKGNSASADTSRNAAAFFQDAFLSLNPIRRITHHLTDFYFGLSALMIAVFGAVCGKEKERTGLWTAVLLFICTTAFLHPIIKELPGSNYFWILWTIALCLIMYCFLAWKSLRKWLFIVFCVLLAVDVIPSLPLVYSGSGNTTAEKQLEEEAKAQLIDKAREITKQRAVFLDQGALGARPQYLLTDYDHGPVQNAFGMDLQTAATADNVTKLNEAMSGEYYPYLFDRALELGIDTIIFKSEPSDDINSVTRGAELSGYQLVESKTGFMLFHIETSENFGTQCQYNGIGIGRSATSLALADPDIEESDSENLSDYTFEELSKYNLVYLSGFTYDDKKKAEQLLQKLSEAGVLIMIDASGIPIDEHTQNQEFLGVTCHPITFQNGYPILYTPEGELDCELFHSTHSDWSTVYLSGLDKSLGYVNETGNKLDFIGTVKNRNIYIIGFNLSYHYSLTHDQTVGNLLQSIVGDRLRPHPNRTLVPLEIKYDTDRITLHSEKNNVNTSLAYHDLFESSQKISKKKNLVYVKSGTTTIQMHYPYFMEGLVMSIVGVLLYIVFFIWLYKREKRKTKPKHQN